MNTITLSIPLAAYGTVATAAALEGVDVSTYVKSHVLTATATSDNNPACKGAPATPNPEASHDSDK